VDAQATIFVVDDDPAVSRALASAGKLLGLPVQAYGSAAAFLEAFDPDQPGCLVLDIKMPGMTGLELQQRLNEEGSRLPIIMISGHADVPIAVEAMRNGALTLLEKPFRLDELIVQIRRALAEDAASRANQAAQSVAANRLGQLTRKEREVLDLLISGKTNKEIASALHLSIRAVEDRRARMMKKMQVRSVAELVRLTASGGR
jgi:FixJ family two-component response regulator